MRDQTPVTVRVVYLARLREAFATAGEALAVPAGSAATVAGLLDTLRQRGVSSNPATVAADPAGTARASPAVANASRRRAR